MNNINITENTINKIKELINEEKNNNLKLRIFVQGGGCSGFQYGFTFEEVSQEDDFIIEKNDVFFLIDSISMQYLNGSKIDYVSDLSGENFVISNPNAKTTCGCGSSFEV